MLGSLVFIAGAMALMAAVFLNKNFVPSMQDDSMRLEASITKTADFDGTAFDRGVSNTPGGVGLPLAAVVNVTAADRADSDETYAFVLEESADNITFTAAGPTVSVDVAAAVATLGAISVPGFISQRYVRVRLDVGGTTPSITYEAWLNPNIVP